MSLLPRSIFRRNRSKIGLRQIESSQFCQRLHMAFSMIKIGGLTDEPAIGLLVVDDAKSDRIQFADFPIPFAKDPAGFEKPHRTGFSALIEQNVVEQTGNQRP